MQTLVTTCGLVVTSTGPTQSVVLALVGAVASARTRFSRRAAEKRIALPQHVGTGLLKIPAQKSKRAEFCPEAQRPVAHPMPKGQEFRQPKKSTNQGGVNQLAFCLSPSLNPLPSKDSMPRLLHRRPGLPMPHTQYRPTTSVVGEIVESLWEKGKSMRPTAGEPQRSHLQAKAKRQPLRS